MVRVGWQSPVTRLSPDGKEHVYLQILQQEHVVADAFGAGTEKQRQLNFKFTKRKWKSLRQVLYPGTMPVVSERWLLLNVTFRQPV
ncbi:hypothetical protein BaRGS_00019986 [Batillaria attramentaria]|uniref:Uncharacterized protein n=1 Tax=Batillaria attramentaria TaxID=370345 RepID=A0ABD0KNW5_9CAEN